MNQHYFDVPFALSGDVTAIPDPLQVGGTVSFTEGWNYNYQRNLSTDPAALPIDRSTMNWLFNQITTALAALQQAGIPEFITSAQNGGTAYSYGKGAAVLWSSTGNAPFTKYVSLNTANTQTPSVADPQGLTTGWQIEVDPISTAAQASAGTDDASIMTPLKVAQQTALRALLAGNSSQVFNVGPATAATHALQLQQAQALRRQYQTVQSYAVASQTLTTTIAGSLVINTYGSGAAAFALPAASTMPAALLDETVYVNLGTGALTITPNGSDTITAPALAGGSQSLASIVLQPGDDLKLEVRASNTWVITGGAAMRQFAPLKAPAIAGGAGQTVGTIRNGKIQVAAAATTGTYTADEVIVGSALGGTKYLLSSVSKSINLATTGAGGMDTGAATASGYLGVYVIYNPSTNTTALLGTIEGAGTLTNVYSGANMPAGYTASALVAVMPISTTAGQFSDSITLDRTTYIVARAIQNTSTPTGSQTTLTSFTTALIPRSCRTIGGTLVAQGSAAAVTAIIIGSSAAAVGIANCTNNNGQGSGAIVSSFRDVPVTTPQTVYWGSTSSAGTPTLVINVSNWTF